MADEKEYLSNINTDDISDEELLKKLKKLETELSEVKTELDKKSKLCLEQEHKIDDLTLEKNNLTEEKNNLQELVNFYEEDSGKPEKTDNKDNDKIKELEIKIINLEEKSKEKDDKIKKGIE